MIGPNEQSMKQGRDASRRMWQAAGVSLSLYVLGELLNYVP